MIVATYLCSFVVVNMRIEKMPREIYQSENGDRWSLCHDEDGGPRIEHQGHLSSGGKRTRIAIGDFLGGRSGPEHQSLSRLIGSLVEERA
jgi:hypothetical protein